MSDSLGIVYFAIRLNSSVLNLPEGQMKVFWGSQITQELQPMLIKFSVFGLVENTLGLVHASTRITMGDDC